MSLKMNSTGGLDVITILPNVNESKHGDSVIYIGKSLYPELMIFDGVNKRWNPYGGVGLTEEQKAKVDGLKSDTKDLLYIDNIIQGEGLKITKNTDNTLSIGIDSSPEEIQRINDLILTLFE
jgi:hypothetical protein